MTASEFAFMAMGLIFGVATGVAIAFVLRVAPPAKTVKLTVSHDAVPRRGSTLASDAFVTAPAEPARGGPADRRMHDRTDEPAPLPVGGRAPATVVAAPAGVPVMRTAVRSGTMDARPASAVASGAPSAVATLAPSPSVAGPLDAPDGSVADGGPAFVRMLHGDHRAMLAIVDDLAGPDPDARRGWQNDLTALVEATIARTIDLGVLEFPLGNAFWDGFTVDQCREIAGALAARGHAFDGHAGWADDMPPGYRELTEAVADVGLDPRRIRAWPTTAEIRDLYRGARIAPEELLSERAPGLDAPAVRELLGSRADGLVRVWAEWDRVRPLLLGPTSAGTLRGA